MNAYMSDIFLSVQSGICNSYVLYKFKVQIYFVTASLYET